MTGLPTAGLAWNRHASSRIPYASCSLTRALSISFACFYGRDPFTFISPESRKPCHQTGCPARGNVFCMARLESLHFFTLVLINPRLLSMLMSEFQAWQRIPTRGGCPGITGAAISIHEIEPGGNLWYVLCSFLPQIPDCAMIVQFTRPNA